MNKDRAKGAIDEVVGSIKRKAGELTSDTPLQIKGIAQQVKGSAENAWGKAKDEFRDACKNTRVRHDTHMTLEMTNSEPEIERNKTT